MPQFTRADSPNPIVNSYRTKDGRWLFLNMLQPDRFWPDLCRRIGHPELIEDERFKDGMSRFTNRVECVKLLDEIFASARSPSGAARSPRPKASGRRCRAPSSCTTTRRHRPTTICCRSIAVTARPSPWSRIPSSSTRSPPTLRPAPDLGQHTEEVLLVARHVVGRSGQVQGSGSDLVTAARHPVIVGVGQLVNRAADPREVMEPLEMMAVVARLAAEDAEIPGRLAEIDSLTVINTISRAYADPAGFLAARLAMSPRDRVYTSMGGNSPQWRVNETADRIARGEVRLALIAGAEAMHGLQLARRAGVQLEWAEAGTPEMVGDNRWGNNPDEQRHHAQLPTNVYPLFENALRAHRGWSIAHHRAYLGELCGGMAAVARDNPYAWFRQGRSAAEIVDVSPANRMIAFPYPKFMNAIIGVDQAAALLMTDAATAKALGIPAQKWIYVRGCGDAIDHWFVSDRVNYWSSPALRLAAQRALAQARLEISAIDHLDLYSCFPCAVQIAADMLGIAPDDPRPLTVTGGLPYHGGPGNNYSTHAIACMVERLRARAGAHGLVSGVGWYLTKHAVGVYSSAAPDHAFEREDPKRYQGRLDAEPHPVLAVTAEGPGTVESYTVQHDRDGQPSVGIVDRPPRRRPALLGENDRRRHAGTHRARGARRPARARPSRRRCAGEPVRAVTLEPYRGLRGLDRLRGFLKNFGSAQSVNPRNLR